VKGREVELESISSRLQNSKDSENSRETGEEQGPQKGKRKTREKRRRPKSERKELDNELYKRLKKSSSTSTDGTADSNTEEHDIFRREFQKKKLNKFKNGAYLNIIYNIISIEMYLMLTCSIIFSSILFKILKI
jgi:hypothetical protein